MIFAKRSAVLLYEMTNKIIAKLKPLLECKNETLGL